MDDTAFQLGVDADWRDTATAEFFENCPLDSRLDTRLGVVQPVFDVQREVAVDGGHRQRALPRGRHEPVWVEVGHADVTREAGPVEAGLRQHDGVVLDVRVPLHRPPFELGEVVEPLLDRAVVGVFFFFVSVGVASVAFRSCSASWRS